MNVFTTEHPMSNTPRMNRWATYFLQSLAVASLLFSALGAAWYWVALTANEDVPDPSWTDHLGDVAGMLIVFPAGLIYASAGGDNLLVKILCLFVDCMFWGSVSVLLYRILWRRIRRIFR